MKLLLIRHGETVDNVAGLYAGVRDSSLTNFGIDQANRLGLYLSKNNKRITHIFASPLTRAFKTAQAVQKAQLAVKDGNGVADQVEITKVPDLIEQDFGYYEGKPSYARSDAKKSGRESHHDQHKHDPGFVDVESKESMCKRADAFLDDHLMPLFGTDGIDSELFVVVVSHGILLSNLWRRLLLRLPRKSLTIAPEVTATRDNLVLEHLGGWSNTGYLELTIRREVEAEHADVAPVPESSKAETETLETPIPRLEGPADVPVTMEHSDTATQKHTTLDATTKVLTGYTTTIVAVDSKAHLVGLKRQRGGIGRLAHDEGQKKLDEFFSKK
jgi:broad specificity phosphatase PhoE